MTDVQDALDLARGVVRRVDFGYFVRPSTETETGRPRVEPLLGYVVRAGDAVLLVDTGMGSHPEVDAHYRPRRRSLPEALAPLGMRPDDVTHVANCHLHFDHCGGNPALGGLAGVRPAHRARRGADHRGLHASRAARRVGLRRARRRGRDRARGPRRADARAHRRTPVVRRPAGRRVGRRRGPEPRHDDGVRGGRDGAAGAPRRAPTAAPGAARVRGWPGSRSWTRGWWSSRTTTRYGCRDGDGAALGTARRCAPRLARTEREALDR